jgi:hypothetical protein
MKLYLISPIDIKYSFRATERYIYEYADYLRKHGKDVEILITKRKIKSKKLNNDNLIRKYRKIRQRFIDCREFLLPLKWHIFIYKDLPRDGIIYFPYSIYDYLYEILFKPKGQKYIIGSHSMHLKLGRMIENHQLLESALNSLVNLVLWLRRGEIKNIYIHAINTAQVEYIRQNFKLIKEENIFYIPNMINTEKYSIAKNKSNKLRVVHIGGTDKDIHSVFSIIKLLNEDGHINDFEFYFIGKLSERVDPELIKMPNLHFLGEISEKSKLKVLSTMDAIIVPSYEAFPLVVLEGLASGLYVLTSKKNAAWRDFKELGIKLFVAENGQPSEYIKILKKLAEVKKVNKNPNKYAIYNRKVIIKNFDEKIILRKILEMFEHIQRK